MVVLFVDQAYTDNDCEDIDAIALPLIAGTPTVHVYSSIGLHEMQYLWGWSGDINMLQGVAATIAASLRPGRETLVCPIYDALVVPSRVAPLLALLVETIGVHVKRGQQGDLRSFAQEWLQHTITNVRDCHAYYSRLIG